MEGNFRESLAYSRLQYGVAKKIDSIEIIRCILNFGACYSRLAAAKKVPAKIKRAYLDSANYYANNAYTMAKKKHDSAYIQLTIASSSNIADRLQTEGRFDSAYNIIIKYFNHQGYLKYYMAKPAFYCSTTMTLAKYFKSKEQYGIAARFARKSLAVALKTKYYAAALSANDFLWNLYDDIHNIDSAYYYLQNTFLYNDSVHSREATEKMMTINFQEQKQSDDMRQQEEDNKKEQEEAVTQAGIGLFIIGFFTLLLVLGRKKVSKRTNDFLGTLFLLMMFEFITLLIHPKIAHWTNDNQLIMFLILVG
jgi:hypothetical protein